MTMAPELDPQGELIRFCRSQNVLLSGGHTVATFAEYNRAIEQGLACSTHTGNAMRQMDRREPGAYGAALLSNQIFSEVICDLFHISQPMLEIMFRIKPQLTLGQVPHMPLAGHNFIICSQKLFDCLHLGR